MLVTIAPTDLPTTLADEAKEPLLGRMRWFMPTGLRTGNDSLENLTERCEGRDDRQ